VKRPWLVTVAGIGSVVLAAGLLLFEPWRAFTSSTIDEAVPGAAIETSAAPASAPPTAATTPAVLSTGRFVDGEHGTSGSARIIELSDGRRFLRLENLSTSDGPDVHVWLSAATAGGSWGKYDDGAYLKLGNLKATHGNQNYLIPDGKDLSRYRSAVIWCDRFNVAFGSAPVKVA
jgi:hypothetical protein